jgi:hypothetical protein
MLRPAGALDDGGTTMSDNVVPFPTAPADARADAGVGEGPLMNAAIEQGFLGAALLPAGANVCRTAAEFLLPEHFAYAVHGRIYRTITRLIDGGQAADPVIVKNTIGEEPSLALHGGTAKYLANLLNGAVGPTIALTYAREIVNAAGLRALIENAQATVEAASSPGARIGDIVAKLRSDLAAGTAYHSGLDEWDASLDLGPIPPRGWLLGNTFCRRFVSSLIADGGVGKTALRLAQCLSAATGRSLTGEHVFVRSRVLLVSLEDDRDELRRRLRAAMLHHAVTDDEIRGWLFLTAPGREAGKLAISQNGVPAVGPLLGKLLAALKRRAIDIVCIDPFVKAHSVEENSNDAMDFVVGLLTQTAIDHNCAVDAPHHVSKGPADPGNASRGRGAGAFKDGGRLVYTLAPMSEDEAKLFGVGAEERRHLVRMDSGKVNIAPSAADATWFKLVGVPIGNRTQSYPKGDEVQTVKPWQPPDFWAQMPPTVANAVLDQIDAGFADGRRYAAAPQATDRAAWPLITQAAPTINETQAKQVVKTWVKNGVLHKKPYRDPVVRREVDGLYVNPAKRPG